MARCLQIHEYSLGDHAVSLQLRQKDRIHAAALASRSKGKNKGFEVRQ